MDTLVAALAGSLTRTTVHTGRPVIGVRKRADGFAVELHAVGVVESDGVVLAVPAFAVAELVAEVDLELAEAHAEIPYASSAIVTLAYRTEDMAHPLAGYGYVVPRIEGTEVLACTWTSSKWAGRAPDDRVLVRVYAGRHGGRDVTGDTDGELVALGRDEVRLQLGIGAEPTLVRIHRWPGGMPQYMLGHLDRLERIQEALERHPGLALAGAAYRGVGIPDCIRSGEAAAHAVTEALERVAR
jgi:oxygen-dependent protoporphyrinogen oxidase